MLITDFYTIKDYQITENHIHSLFFLNTNHEVYLGHFPEQAVVPGVIQLQLIKELVEKTAKRKLLLGEMSFAKYLNPILPVKGHLLKLNIDFQEIENHIKISATIKDENVVYTKMRATLFSKSQ